MHKKIFLSLSLLASLMLTACVNFGSPKQERSKTYMIAPAICEAEKQNSIPIQKTLLVNSGVAAPAYQGTAMFYTQNDFELQQFAVHRWVAPPTQMISAAVAEALSCDHLFHAVLVSPPSAQADNNIVIKLLKLQQNFSGQQSQINLVLQVAILDGRNNKLLAMKTFVKNLSAEPNPIGGVQAVNQAVQDEIPLITQFIRQTLRN